VVTYHTNRVTAERDITGGWSQRPRAWRFVILRFAPGAILNFAPEVAELVTQDHRNFLRELRSFRVDADILIDNLSGQTALAKYVLELDRYPETTAPDAERDLVLLVDRLKAEAAEAFGLRLVEVNRVLSEGETEPIDEPGQRPLGRPLAETTKQAYLEIYFDQQEWAEDWFARPVVHALLADPCFAMSRVYRVEEQCQVDKR
jgi:hypothetical protein